MMGARGEHQQKRQTTQRQRQEQGQGHGLEMTMRIPSNKVLCTILLSAICMVQCFFIYVAGWLGAVMHQKDSLFVVEISSVFHGIGTATTTTKRESNHGNSSSWVILEEHDHSASNFLASSSGLGEGDTHVVRASDKHNNMKRKNNKNSHLFVMTPKAPIITSECQSVLNSTSSFNEFCKDYNFGPITKQKSRIRRKSSNSSRKDLKCQQHDRVLYEGEKQIILKTQNSTGTVHVPNCKTLWIVAMSEGTRATCKTQESDTNKGSKGDGEGDGYKAVYAAALQSARQHAGDSLQPVLLIGRGDLEDQHPHDTSRRRNHNKYYNSSGNTVINDSKNEEDIPLSPFGQWAEEQGVIVRQVRQLSFQEIVDEGLPHYTREKRVGLFLVFDIPQVLEDHGLLHSPGICSRHILYTDADILFVNHFSREDIYAVTHRMMLSNKILSYGRDFLIWRPLPVNTGVIVMDVPGFAKEWPKILNFAAHQKVFPEHDQTLLYEYYARSRKYHLSQVDLLPLYMHWKVYWRLEPSKLEDIKIVHFHGAKPGSGVEDMANCVMDMTNMDTIPLSYRFLLQEAVCCDHGRTAATILQMYRAWRPKGFEEICGK